MTCKVCHMQVVVDEILIEEVLGPQRFSHNDAAQRIAGAGSAAGLVWTQAGGQVLLVAKCIDDSDHLSGFG